ncbi:MAG: trigger factor [Syntrophales bacterium]
MEQNILDSVKIEDLSPVKKKLVFEIPWEAVRKELDDVYRKVSKSAKIKGFRPGKIPRQILERYYKEFAENETVTNLVNHFFWEAMEKNSVMGVSRPEIDQHGIEPDKNFSFSATVEVEPAIEPKDYIGITLTKEIESVTDKQVDERLEGLRQVYATLEDITESRSVAEGDFTTIDFQGEVDGNPLKELKAEGHFLEIGSKKMVPGFEEQIIGMNPGETKEISVTFPEDYPFAPVVGKTVKFIVTVHGIKEKKLPPLDETFVQNLDKYDSLESLRADIRKSLEEMSQQKAQEDLRKKMADILLEKNDFDVPDSIVERQLQYMVKDFQRRVYQSGMQVKQSPEMIAKLRDQFKEEAVRTVRTFLLMKSIAGKESIKVSDDDMNGRILELSEKYRQAPDALKQNLEKDGTLDHIRYDLLDSRVFDFLTKNAHITEISKPSQDVQEERV